MKGYNDFSIGDSFLLSPENVAITIRDYRVIQMHNKRNDYRTKKVDTVVWCLFADNGNEYRKTSEDLQAMIQTGKAERKAVQ